MKGTPRLGALKSFHNIYAHCHVRTNQVLYSRYPMLEHEKLALKELPDVGSNSRPPNIRRDHWRRFWSVHFGNTDLGRTQGLMAWKLLREWRKLHETNWTPSPLLTRLYTSEEIEKLEKKLAERGGNKVETPYDLIKRAKKRLRRNAVMDQKANSVADLAAVLLELQDRGAARARLQKETSSRLRRKEVELMLKYAVEATKIDVSEMRIPKIEDIIAASDDKSKLGTRLAKKQQRRLRTRRARIRFAAQVVPKALLKAQKAGYRLSSEHDAVIEAAGMPVSRLAQPQTPSTRDNDEVDANEGLFDYLKDVLPAFPSRNQDPATFPKKGPLVEQQKLLDAPVYDMKGVQVRWENIFDAEYGEYWPERVKHVDGPSHVDEKTDEKWAKSIWESTSEAKLAREEARLQARLEEFRSPSSRTIQMMPLQAIRKLKAESKRRAAEVPKAEKVQSPSATDSVIELEQGGKSAEQFEARV